LTNKQNEINFNKNTNKNEIYINAFRKKKWWKEKIK
jgi:hypothetical protein